ncbi:MAG: YfcE family phosphodiesterase [Candidatus Nanohalobium sp.]
MIAVLSDSHIPRRAEDIPEAFKQVLENAETIVHCGDFVSKNFKQELEEFGDLVAAKGNCDVFDLPPSQTFSRKGLEFGVYHGAGITPRGHHPTLVKTAETISCQVLFHGHSHRAEAVKTEGKILVNPGSCTGVSGGTSNPDKPSMARVEIREEDPEVEIVDNRLETMVEKNFSMKD